MLQIMSSESEWNEMIELNVIFHSEPEIINNFFVNIPQNESVSALKKEICKKTYLEEDTMLIVYGSLHLRDNDPICAYNIHNGVTINVFKKKKVLDLHDLFNISVAFQALRMSRKYLQIWNNLRAAPKLMHDIIKEFPELKKDEKARTLLRFPNKLRELKTTYSIYYLMKKHPILISAVLKFSELIFKKIQAYQLVTSYSKDDQDKDSEDDIIHDALEFSIPRNKTPFASKTNAASQLASLNHWAGQQQIDATGDSILSRRYLFHREAERPLTLEEMDLQKNLQKMNNLGMMNDIKNAAALKLANCFETAVDLVKKREGSPNTSHGSVACSASNKHSELYF